MRPPENRTAPGANRRGGNVLAFKDGWKHPLSSQYPRAHQAAIFTARPRGTRWAVAAISPQGEAVKLGDFARRALALNALPSWPTPAGGGGCHDADLPNFMAAISEQHLARCERSEHPIPPLQVLA